jgi:hypothetical protein
MPSGSPCRITAIAAFELAGFFMVPPWARLRSVPSVQWRTRAPRPRGGVPLKRTAGPCGGGAFLVDYARFSTFFEKSSLQNPCRPYLDDANRKTPYHGQAMKSIH